MGLFKWAAKTTYYTGKKAVRGTGRSIARDIRSVSHPTYEHDGCSVNHRSPEAMLKCRRGSNYSPETRSSSRGRQKSVQQPALAPDQMICGSCTAVIPLGHVTCPICQNVLLDEACLGCGGSWRMCLLKGELAGYCQRCNWYITTEGLFQVN